MAGWWLLAAWGLTWTLTAAQECSRYGPRKSCGELTGLALPVLSDLLTAPGERPWERRSRWCHSHARPAAGPPDIIEEKCRAQGCCWDPLKTRDPHIDLADCFFANNGRSDYQLVHSEQQGMLFTAVPAMRGAIQHCPGISHMPCTGCRDCVLLTECVYLPQSLLPLVCVGLQIWQRGLAWLVR